MVLVSLILFRSKSKWYKHQKNKKFALNLQRQIIQILTNDGQMLILCLSQFITTVLVNHFGMTLSWLWKVSPSLFTWSWWVFIIQIFFLFDKQFLEKTKTLLQFRLTTFIEEKSFGGHQATTSALWLDI